MRIGKDQVVAIEYTIRNEQGEVVDTSEGREPLVYLHGYRQIVPGVEVAIEGLGQGASVSVTVGPKDAYGERDPGAIVIIPRTAFPPEEELEPGTMFRAFRPDGRPFVFCVMQASAERVIVDANHPLAGQTLDVDVMVVSVRDASVEEVQHGHVHQMTSETGIDFRMGARESSLPA